FLVLLRRAASISRRESMRSWLHGVAYRVAARARAAAVRRRAREIPLGERPAIDAWDEVLWRDLRTMLDVEVARLPEKYRRPFLLCILEGKTLREASAALRCPLGTVATRLAKARELLRGRLSRRALVVPASALSAVLAQHAANAGVPVRIIDAALRFAVDPKTAGG